MRKEIVLAIIVGIMAGLGLTYVLYQVRQQVFRNRTPAQIEESRQQNTLPPTPTPGSTLSIQQPVHELLTDDPQVQVVGRAIPHSYIVILAAGREYITTADRDGDFAHEVALQAGGNRLTIMAISPDGQTETVLRSVVYSTVNLDVPTGSDSAQTTPAPGATPSTAPSATTKATPLVTPRSTPRATPSPTPRATPSAR